VLGPFDGGVGNHGGTGGWGGGGGFANSGVNGGDGSTPLPGDDGRGGERTF
jgi:hypothetical protein